MTMVNKGDTPDSARAWAIAIADGFINALLSGLTRATGLLYVALINTYGASRFQANLPFSIRVVVRNLAGPVVGALGQRFGIRNVVLIGGVLASVGILLCTFATSITWITFLWGGVHGFGVSLCGLGLLAVTQWFDKYKATGVGLAFSGSCFGSLVLPLFIEYALGGFGLFGCFLVTSALILNVLPAAIIMRQPSWMLKKTRTLSQISLPPFETNTIFEKTVVQSKTSPKVFGLSFTQRRFTGELIEKEDGKLKLHENDSLANANEGISNPVYESAWEELAEVNIYQKENKKATAEKKPTLPSMPDDVRQETSILKAIRILICDPIFYMISLSLAAMAMILDPVFIILVDFMLDKGFTEKVAKYFISALAIGDLIGRLSFGWVTDKKFLTVRTYMMLMQMLQGTCFMLLPIFDGFYVLMFMVTLFGAITGAALVMIPILVQTYLKSVQSLAMGFISFITGMATLTVPYLIGYFRDEIGSYNGVIYVSGGITITVAFLWFSEPLLLKWRIKLNEGKQVTAEGA
ncbi:monocarboxylate transporter 5-like [Argiope bruennichi]|uniref:monocarboxylate transporter 5-like n=1 Tax=Argiope bruennichi TaxID=94029 RepID=UPI002494B13F|nr:monocarboxylate transporter 5-like [Argiope bruennichi]XP_055933610.1 monocarboxylate transporter 5-like [Argiope bruennichi]